MLWSQYCPVTDFSLSACLRRSADVVPMASFKSSRGHSALPARDRGGIAGQSGNAMVVLVVGATIARLPTFLEWAPCSAKLLSAKSGSILLLLAASFHSFVDFWKACRKARPVLGEIANRPLATSDDTPASVSAGPGCRSDVCALILVERSHCRMPARKCQPPRPSRPVALIHRPLQSSVPVQVALVRALRCGRLFATSANDPRPCRDRLRRWRGGSSCVLLWFIMF